MKRDIFTTLAFVMATLERLTLQHSLLCLVAGVIGVVLAFDVIPGRSTATREGCYTWYTQGAISFHEVAGGHC
jgi:hypothetical protein